MRDFSALVKAALAGSTVIERNIVRVTLPGPAIFGASDGTDTFVWNNGTTGDVTFVPLAEGLRVSLPAVQAALRTDAATISVSATDPRLLSQLLEEDYRGAPTDIARLIFDPATGQPGEEVLIWRGLMNVARLVDGVRGQASGSDIIVDASTLSVTVAPPTVNFKRAIGRFGNNPDQTLYRDAADNGFQDTALAGVSQFIFGQSGPSSPVHIAGNVSPAGAPSGVGALGGGLALGDLYNRI